MGNAGGDKGNEQVVEQILGYLNFSSGARDAQFLANLDRLFSEVDDQAESPAYHIVLKRLSDELTRVSQTNPTFKDARQAENAIAVVRQDLIPAYRNFHRDLLFHQTDEELFGSFFTGVLFESTLSSDGLVEDHHRCVEHAMEKLNDYVGYRPIATLENQRLETYPHERLRPIPLYVKGAGVCSGKYFEIVSLALKLLRETDEDLLETAQFEPDVLEELAYDPRAYDFDHPVNKRPNHHFGQWDPDLIDGKGRYSRFVIQQVTLDALASRVTKAGEIPYDELLIEAAAVLAGTILMASGISGNGPGAYDSNMTLTTLLPMIASYRDAFYERLFQTIDGDHGNRLREESVEKRQPFGGARQHLNARLAHCRASQLEHVHLAMIYGRMGFPDAALRQANVVPVASARMICRIDCELDAAHQAIQAGDLETAAEKMPDVHDLLTRSIECGAIIDPWNILGFDGNFSLFPAIENSVRDHRADDLVALMEQIFALYSRLWSEAAAKNQEDIASRVKASFQALAMWWRQFATHEVQSVDAVDADVVFRAAEHVAKALSLWHQGGASTGDVAFWASHTSIFDSPKAYALVVDALMQRGDDVASMAILIHWLSQADTIPLEEGDSSYHMLAERWMARQHAQLMNPSADADPPAQVWGRVVKFFDYLEANAEELWRVPEFQLSPAAPEVIDEQATNELAEEEEEDAGADLFRAAYENVIYEDSADDGQEGAIYQPEFDHDELEEVSEQLIIRLEFITTLSCLWKVAAGLGTYCLAETNGDDEKDRIDSDARLQALNHWLDGAIEHQKGLHQLMEDVGRYPLITPSGDHDSMVEYDRVRLAKESLLERIIATQVGNRDAVRWLLASRAANEAVIQGASPVAPAGLGSESGLLVRVFAAMFMRDIDLLRDSMPELLEALDESALLYVPLAKGGNPHDIVAAREMQQALLELFASLPRLGLLSETRLLLEAAREMERNNPVGHGAVTEFDELFKIGYTAMVESLVQSSQHWSDEELKDNEEDKLVDRQSALFDVVERITETMLVTWLAHSRTLRLSVLEKVGDRNSWERLVAFVERYGEDLFTQRFFNLGNLRAILHQGVDAWLRQLQEDPADYDSRLLDELENRLPRDEAVAHLTLVLEAVIENYAEYRDYNSTTTQSDRGELLYMLLDFLRLRTRYDRVAWHLRPVVWSHATLVRHGQKRAARLWRRALTERLGEEPQKYLNKLDKLQKKYAMQMPTVADRINERFLQPLQIDRIKALVETAMRDPSDPDSRKTFELLEHEVEVLTREPSGVGLDIPPWLASLEDEVDRVRHKLAEIEVTPWDSIPPVQLSLEEIHRQLSEMREDANLDD